MSDEQTPEPIHHEPAPTPATPEEPNVAKEEGNDALLGEDTMRRIEEEADKEDGDL